MLIVCPACSASYRLDPRALSAGRMVRCARCKTEWRADAPVEPAPEVRPAAPIAPPVAMPSTDYDDWDVDIETKPEPLPAIAAVEDAEPIDMIEDGPRSDGAPPTVTSGKRRTGRDPRRRPHARPTTRRAWADALSRRPAVAAALLGVLALAAAVVLRADIVQAAPSLASLYASVGLPVNVRGLDISDVRSLEEMDEGVPMLLVSGNVTNVAHAPIDVPRLRLAVTAYDGREVYAWTTVVSRNRLGPGETSPFRARLASPPPEGARVVVRFLARQDLMAHPH